MKDIDNKIEESAKILNIPIQERFFLIFLRFKKSKNNFYVK